MQQTFCVGRDHCSCSGGFVCSDTKSEGECAAGTGGYVFCEKKNGTDVMSTTSAKSTAPSTVATTTTGTTRITPTIATTIAPIITTTGSTGACQQCDNHDDCQDEFYCCPYQLLWFAYIYMMYFLYCSDYFSFALFTRIFIKLLLAFTFLWQHSKKSLKLFVPRQDKLQVRCDNGCTGTKGLCKHLPLRNKSWNLPA